MALIKIRNIHSGESVNENGITYINLTIRPNNTHNIQEVVITDNPSLVANSVFVSTKKLDNIDRRNQTWHNLPTSHHNGLKH